MNHPPYKNINALPIKQQIQADIKRFAKIELNSALPIVAKSQEIQKSLFHNQVLIVAGETGCGKTTQLPQICLQAGLGISRQIAHTQPRRVAATSVAIRIASELKTELGNEVGYAVRFSDKTSKNTRVKLMTDGVLLAELQSDPLLQRYEVIIIDEAHERSLNIDFLLGFLKQILSKRKELKLIITSATIDPVRFSKYFANAPIITVEGRVYPVEVIYQPMGLEERLTSLEENKEAGALTRQVKRSVESLPENALEKSVLNAIDHCIAKSTGDILIFSYGEAEIRQLTKSIEEQNYSQLVVFPLYARLAFKEQQAIFAPNQKRKIIIATNIAETSLTIPNIFFVIDIGMVRISRYSHRNKIQQLPIEKISKASANQRKGRSGRVAPGLCIRLYAEDDFDTRIDFTEPEIKRTNLSSIVLRLKSLGISNVEDFPFIQPPSEQQWKVAFNLLFEIGAMDKNKQITAIGQRMSRLPLDPQLSRILLDENNGALKEMLVVTSFLCVRDVRIRPPKEAAKGAQKKAEICHQTYQDKSSDVLSIINLWNFLNDQKSLTSNSKFKRWCSDNFINFIGWLEWRNTYFQIKNELGNLKNKNKAGQGKSKLSIRSVDLSLQNKELPASVEQVHQALIPGFISHLLMKTSEEHYQAARGLKVWLHPSSILFSKKPPWLLSLEMVETNKLYARNNIPVKPEWFESAVGHLLKSTYHDIHWRKSKGHAAAFLNQSLFGLPIVNKRLVDYGKVDAEVARKLFLRDGLLANQVNVKLPFLEKNQVLVDQIKREEEKLRRSDLLIDDQAFMTLYQEKIPEPIYDVYRLRRWLKKDWISRNELLTFTPRLLRANRASSIEDYPSDVFVKGVILPLSYRFAPGQAEDGIHVSIPVEMLSQFEDKDFEWLVPGYLKDKIIATLKNLPKALRKPLIPIADTAERCLRQMMEVNYTDKDFKNMLRESLLRTKAFKLPNDEIDTDNIPTHLKMKYVALKADTGRNRDSNLKAEFYRDLKSIRRRYANDQSVDNNRSNRRVAELTNVTSENLKDWPKENFHIEKRVKRDGQIIRLFNGLTDRQGHVCVTQYPSLAAAKSANRLGVCRLIQIDNRTLIKNFKNSWPERRELEQLGLRHGGFSVLLDWVICSNILQLIDSSEEVVENAQAFAKIRDLSRVKLREKAAEDLNKLLKCLQSTRSIYQNINRMQSDVYQTSLSDVTRQLGYLWSAECYMQKGDRVFADYKRYLLGIASRLSRIEENFPRESKLLADWLEWVGWWQEFRSQNLNFEANKQHWTIFWLLEEYRLSLFALNIKVEGKISVKKLQKAFEKLEFLTRT